MVDVLILIGSLVVILFGAELFTNGVEWLGNKFKLSEGAVGSVLAAVGTALPETMIPIIAIVFGAGAAKYDIGIGAILGAPFMLSTLALLISGVAALVYTAGKRRMVELKLDRSVMLRDLSFFLVVYALAILAAFIPVHWGKVLVAVGLLGAYGVYVYQTVFKEEPASDQDEVLAPLIFAKKAADPGTGIVVFQVLTALVGIVLGADYFVKGIEHLSRSMGVSPFIVSVILAPVATELPEKFNSVIWIGKGKDTLALGNITGAMVFQSSVIPAIGILLTPWVLAPLQLVNAGLALASAGLVYATFRLRGTLKPQDLLFGGFFYLMFIAYLARGTKI